MNTQWRIVRDDVKRTQTTNANTFGNGAVKVTMGKDFRFGGKVAARAMEADLA